MMVIARTTNRAPTHISEPEAPLRSRQWNMPHSTGAISSMTKAAALIKSCYAATSKTEL